MGLQPTVPPDGERRLAPFSLRPDPRPTRLGWERVAGRRPVSHLAESNVLPDTYLAKAARSAGVVSSQKSTGNDRIRNATVPSWLRKRTVFETRGRALSSCVLCIELRSLDVTSRVREPGRVSSSEARR